MSVIRTVMVYQLRDLARSRWLLAYGLFFAAATEGLLRYGGSGTKALLSLGTIVLFVVPLVTVVYGTVYLYHSREFTELLLAQPVRRTHVFAGLSVGISAALTAAMIVGLTLPFLAHGAAADATLRRPFATLIGVATALTCVFSAIAGLIAIRCEDRLRGLGAAIAAWLGLALLYDGVVLILLVTFGDQALEKPVLAAMLLNPVDLARVLLLMQFDTAALMGYTGAVFQRFFGGAGAVAAAAALLAWITVPALAAARAFRRRDF